MAVYQIFYDAATRAALDPGFTPLDNTANERPDWREYWPIRKWFAAAPPDDGGHLGFLSPKFRAKTGLGSDAVLPFIAAHAEYDVISFSPFIDQSALFINIFEQGEMNHPGLLALANEAARLVAPGLDVAAFVNAHERFIFSNFFVARRRFWDLWNGIMERLFALAEADDTETGRALNARAAYRAGVPVPNKVFLMERVASLILNLYPSLTVKAYPPFSLPTFGAKVAERPLDLAVGNALKLAYLHSAEPVYLQAFSAHRQAVLSAPR